MGKHTHLSGKVKQSARDRADDEDADGDEKKNTHLSGKVKQSARDRADDEDADGDEKKQSGKVEQPLQHDEHVEDDEDEEDEDEGDWASDTHVPLAVDHTLAQSGPRGEQAKARA